MRRRGLEAAILLAVVAAVVGVALSGGAASPRHHNGQRRVAERTRPQPAAERTPPPPANSTRPQHRAERTPQVTPEPPMPAATMGPGRLFTVYFYSEALHRRADYLVYLPAGYTAGRRLPVFYLLHGMPGRPMAFTLNAHIEAKLEALIRLHEVRPMILVFPDGRIGGRTATDSEWANTRAGRFESYIVDVVHNVDQRFATLADRHDRAIAGLSAGAYGAANVGLHQVALFGLIQVWSGYFLQTRTGVFAHASRAQLHDNSPLEYVYAMRSTLKRYPLRLFIYTGTHDSDRFQTPPMAAALHGAGAHVGYAVYAGGHSWNLWSPRVDQMLIMASRFFGSP